jgi:hypothetical protein
MQFMTDIARLTFDHRLELWSVVIAGLLLAWIDRVTQARRMRDYDAWWYFHLRRPDTKMSRRGGRQPRSR